MARALTGRFGHIGVLLAIVLTLTRCSAEPNPLAPYGGERPLQFLKVTQSFTPDIQWVGGRVAAVGVNRGQAAALDSTLVWLVTADDDAVGSHVTLGTTADGRAALDFGGVPLDSLVDGEEYTFWLATKQALDAGLETSRTDPHAFIDTTVTMALVLRGTSRGGVDVDLRITKDETLLGTAYKIDWSPAVPFRQVAIRKGAGSAGFRDLVWHIVQPEGEPDAILPPLTIGQAPEGTDVAVAWPESGFEQDIYTIWMTNSDWAGNFGLRPAGMTYFVAFASNFE